MPILKQKWFWFALALLIVVLDQLTKIWVEAEFMVGQRLNILPVFDLTLLYNKGAAFSFLSNAGGWQRWFLTGISAVASIVITVWIYRTPMSQRLLIAALTFILGGAVGNLIDRAMQGQVVDFLLFYYNGNYFPAFNLADSAITLGAFLMILDMFFDKKIVMIMQLPEIQGLNMSDQAVRQGGRILLNFALSLQSGEEVDSNYGSTPVELTLGNGDMPASFEAVLVGVLAGETVQQTIACEDAFGISNDDNRQRFKRSTFDDNIELTPGLVVSFADAAGGELPGVVIDSLDDSQPDSTEYVWVDFNHPLADKDIVFKATIHEVLA